MLAFRTEDLFSEVQPQEKDIDPLKFRLSPQKFRSGYEPDVIKHVKFICINKHIITKK